jgi:glycoside/pentoside/hexuronide:cation symporter, GPH family
MSVPDSASQKLSFREKAGYALGDAGANFVFQTLMVFQMTYYTKVFGITVAAASWLFLFGRLFDAFIDPLMGVVADRTKSRWGRFRPWLLWSALPFALVFWAVFTTPDLGPHGKLLYAWVAYLALMAVYTLNNVPYCALNGVMTGDVNERTSLSTYRFFAVMATGFVVQGVTWPLVAKFGGGDDAKGWSITMGLYAAVSVVFFVITFFSVKERVQPDPNQHSSVKQDLADAFSNRPWVILFVATLSIFVMLAVRGGSLPLFTQFVVDHAALGDFLHNIGFVQIAGSEPTGMQRALDTVGYLVHPDLSNVQAVGFGLFSMAGSVMTIVGVLLSKPLSERFGKRGVFTVCLGITGAATLWLYYIPADAIGTQLFQGLVWSLAYGPTIPLLWSMIADAADFGEWTNNRRATGFVFAGVVFALKAGLGLGGFIGGQVLAAHGFAEGVETAARSMHGIRMTVAIYPSVFIALAVVTLLRYPITKELNLRIGRELAERRARYAPTS